MLKFYMPFYYLIYSRLKSKIDFISWIIIFIIPPFILTYTYVDINFGSFILLFLLSQIIFNTLYEIGYIENDIATTKSEEKPTLRLDEKSYAYIQKNYNKIITFRYLTVFISIALLYVINSYFELKLNILPFLLLLVLNRVFFYWHNHVRSRWNLLTFSMLAITKYIFPFILFVESDKLLFLILLSIVLFPLLRVIEHSTHKRYDFTQYAQFIGNHDKFRVAYYSFFILLGVALYFFSIYSKEDFVVAMALLLYFFFYRVASYLLLHKGLYKRDEIKNKDLYVKDI